MKLTKNQWEKLGWLAHPYKQPAARDGRQENGWYRTFCALEKKGLCLYTQGSDFLMLQEEIWTATGKGEAYQSRMAEIAAEHPDVYPKFRPLFLYPDKLPWDIRDSDLLKTTLHGSESWKFAPSWTFTDKGVEVWCEHSGEQVLWLLFADVYTVTPGNQRKRRQKIWEHYSTKDEAMEAYRALMSRNSPGESVHCNGVYRDVESSIKH